MFIFNDQNGGAFLNGNVGAIAIELTSDDSETNWHAYFSVSVVRNDIAKLLVAQDAPLPR